ncbi:MAG: tRNA preQ1(34) S-adenosylmethionine ribosyltransferase-isomerase QueA [Bacteroidetes bacterium]|nr:tRNA preQ1(34) S-adenosylmethionine ribosyltransferase-isomerase QueA [Bacteroidota bacterium]MCY4224946.1 tRNA preQ1(34) S-adenosylmethionine ribosyltransferase-isomerase QueA [Bacteroidota bacterium]
MIPLGTERFKLSDFHYEVPRDLIANYPADPRDSSRLMVVDREKETIEHRHFYEITEYFSPEDVLVVNNTKVFPARLRGRKEKTDAKIEVFLLRELNSQSRLWDVIVEPARKIRIGNKLFFKNGLVAEVIDNTTSRGRTIRLDCDGDDEMLYRMIDEEGLTPLPPYIKRKAETEDIDRYQTMFAEHRGAVAAPTAGLHFTPNLVNQLTEHGVQIVPVTLHVGLGTFSNISVEDLTKHRMNSEYFSVSQHTADSVNRALDSQDNHVTICGTTVVRAVESTLTVSRHLKPKTGWTDKFIYPPYQFAVTERLITNFHMPASTLMMLTSAFTGYELLKEAYAVAIDQKYRLYSFGDAMLIL